jgi:hypothetical protein
MPVNIFDELKTLLETLDVARIEYALCGGLAYSIHVAPRATKDIDLLVPAEQVESIVALTKARLGFFLDSGVLPFPSSGMEVRRVSKVVGDELLPLDLILVSSITEAVWATRECGDWEGVPLWIVSRQGLIAMKRAAARPSDLVDLARLEELDDE